MQNELEAYPIVHEHELENCENQDEITVVADTPEKDNQIHSAEKQNIKILENNEFYLPKTIHSDRNNHGAVEINESDDEEQDECNGLPEEYEETKENLKVISTKSNFVNEIPLGISNFM